jgi:hypothetical protein
MTETLFRDAEAVIIEHLDTALTVPVAGRVPDPRPPRFVRVERLGGGRETRVSDAARVAVEAWAATDADAAVLLNTARQALFDAEGTLFGVDEYGGPTRLPDPYSNMSRYTASFTVRVRALP